MKPKLKKVDGGVSIRVRCRDVAEKDALIRAMRRVRGVYNVRSSEILLAGIKAMEGK